MKKSLHFLFALVFLLGTYPARALDASAVTYTAPLTGAVERTLADKLAETVSVTVIVNPRAISQAAVGRQSRPQVEALTAAFETSIASLPEDERFGVRMLLEGASTFERDHPLTKAFGTMY